MRFRVLSIWVNDIILVSACLAGIRCRWNGKASPCAKVIALVRNGKAIPLCPEQLGGLPTPRPAAEQRKGKVVDARGKDYTAAFANGAREGLKIAKMAKCRVAILKSKSPSCGCGLVYDGTFSGKLRKGDGVFAGMLKRNGILVTGERKPGQ
jgi:uncharacterized protein YbbK (DUF523 family)